MKLIRKIEVERVREVKVTIATPSGSPICPACGAQTGTMAEITAPNSDIRKIVNQTFSRDLKYEEKFDE